MSAYYRSILDTARGVLMRVQFTTQGRDVDDYAVVLLLDTEHGLEAIRVYDSAHGHNVERAADEGLAVVLVSADGSTRVLKPDLAAH